MKIFGWEHHRQDRPWDEAPPYAVELYAMGLIIMENQMATQGQIDQLKSDIAVLVSSALQTITDAVAKAQADSDDPRIDTLDQTVRNAIATLHTSLSAPVPGLPVTPVTQPSPAPFSGDPLPVGGVPVTQPVQPVVDTSAAPAKSPAP